MQEVHLLAKRDGDAYALRRRGRGLLLPLLGRYNIAPTQAVLAVGQAKDGGRKAAALRRGLIPSWAKEAGAKIFNANAETLLKKPSLRDSLLSEFKQSRALCGKEAAGSTHFRLASCHVRESPGSEGR